jgi:transcription elongation factor Elf1
MHGIDMPKNRFSKQHETNMRERQALKKPSYISKTLRSCPSCKQDAVVEVNSIGTKVVVHCKQCFLKYEFTRFPAFEEIDYYSKMLDFYHKETPKTNTTNVTESNLNQSNLIIVTCKLCNLGNLSIRGNHNKGAMFVKCDNEDCGATHPITHRGNFTLSTKQCEDCDWPVLFWEMKGLNKPGQVCFNPKCGHITSA